MAISKGKANGGPGGIFGRPIGNQESRTLGHSLSLGKSHALQVKSLSLYLAKPLAHCNAISPVLYIDVVAEELCRQPFYMLCPRGMGVKVFEGVLFESILKESHAYYCRFH